MDLWIIFCGVDFEWACINTTGSEKAAVTGIGEARLSGEGRGGEASSSETGMEGWRLRGEEGGRRKHRVRVRQREVGWGGVGDALAGWLAGFYRRVGGSGAGWWWFGFGQLHRRFAARYSSLVVGPLALAWECAAFAWTSRPRRDRGAIVAVHMLIFACAAGNPAGRLLVWFGVSGSASAELGLA